MRITRKQILDTADTHLYVFADDLKANTYEGQAEVCWGLRNALMVPTRIWNCATPQAQFKDCDFDWHKAEIDKHIEAIRQYVALHPHCTVVIFPKIGRGCSNMKLLAPRCYAYLLTQLRKFDSTYET